MFWNPEEFKSTEARLQYAAQHPEELQFMTPQQQDELVALTDEKNRNFLHHLALTQHSSRLDPTTQPQGLAWSPQHLLALKLLNQPKIRTLLSKPDKNGNTPLHLAAFYAVDTTRSLIFNGFLDAYTQAGFSLQAENRNGETFLHKWVQTPELRNKDGQVLSDCDGNPIKIKIPFTALESTKTKIEGALRKQGFSLEQALSWQDTQGQDVVQCAAGSLIQRDSWPEAEDLSVYLTRSTSYQETKATTHPKTPPPAPAQNTFYEDDRDRDRDRKGTLVLHRREAGPGTLERNSLDTGFLLTTVEAKVKTALEKYKDARVTFFGWDTRAEQRRASQKQIENQIAEAKEDLKTPGIQDPIAQHQAKILELVAFLREKAQESEAHYQQHKGFLACFVDYLCCCLPFFTRGSLYAKTLENLATDIETYNLSKERPPRRH